MALPSTHIGSGPGEVGSSGMQVKPLVPWRSMFILPSAPIVAIEACFARAAGAAFSALATSCFSLGAFAACAGSADAMLSKDTHATMQKARLPFIIHSP